MARLSLMAILLIGAVTAIVFGVAPELDLAIAAYFDAPAIKAIVQQWMPTYQLLRNAHATLTVGVALLPIVSFIVKLCRPQWPALPNRAGLLMLVSLALGPGLLVNGILKTEWSRPRPISVTQFGGEREFKPWWDPRGTCDSNCSFVSGEASSAFWLLAPAVVAPARWRLPAVGAALLFGTVVGIARMAAAGHFFTDVVFAGVLTALVIWLVHGFLYRWPRTRLCEHAIDARIARLRTAWLAFWRRHASRTGSTMK